MGEKSTVARANSKSPSVRTTIPKSIADRFDLGVGDVIEWDVVLDKGKASIRLRKMTAEG
jgi:bifunctional DNA-binding transcriptional regulator/antitoxin component of YhaV-PrlF toxin-antitoxin module